MAEQSGLATQRVDEATESLKIGKAAINCGEVEKGLEIYQSILEVDPDNKIARQRIRKLGGRPAIKPPKLSKKRLAPVDRVKELMILADSGRCLAAMDGLEGLLPQYPRDSILHFLKGNLERELKRVKESIVSYTSSIELNPRYSPTHLNLGCSYMDLGDSEAAIECLEKAIELDRRNYMAFYHLALVRAGLGDLDEASENYLRALRIEPGHADSNNNLGKIFCDQGQVARSIKLFERAIEENPDFVEAHENLGIAKQELG